MFQIKRNENILYMTPSQNPFPRTYGDCLIDFLSFQVLNIPNKKEWKYSLYDPFPKSFSENLRRLSYRFPFFPGSQCSKEKGMKIFSIWPLPKSFSENLRRLSYRFPFFLGSQYPTHFLLPYMCVFIYKI